MHRPLEGSGGASNWGLLITVPICLVMIFYFLASGLRSDETRLPAEELIPAWYTPETARAEDLANKSMVGNCFLCHAYWTGLPDPTVVRPRFVHGTVKLNHGTNDRCYNCHLIQDRNKYTADDGSGIMHVNVEKLCQRCHGLIYKDWQNGTHGVRNGKWLPLKEFEIINFKCTECHDPHSPVFQYKKYTPPPIWPAKLVRRSAEG
ncbi:hypothetical protein D1AOALGA4SA_8627 [Olavius algarvensis Delta 1 endosymbiont]|nr:hypothetical protein D1AOALGA4SA_8627 [Olavius algarvensis Delta 1 endosymbiont]